MRIEDWHSRPTVAATETRWKAVLAVLAAALFMTALDNLVVTTALPSIRVALDAPVQHLQWAVNAYTLAFAVLLLPAAAVGDRLGRRRVFLAGVAAFTAFSAAAAASGTIWQLAAARAAQGAAAAFVLPLTLTLLTATVPAAKRGLAIGVWSGISGLGVALGPLVGGAVVAGLDWRWIFLLNVPVGVAVLPVARRILTESHGPNTALDVRGVLLSSAGLLCLVMALLWTESGGWSSLRVLGALVVGALLLTAFVRWEQVAQAPMLRLGLFRSRQFTSVTVAAFAMFFGIFGAAFFVAQYFQTALGHDPLVAGAMTLPWTAMPMIVAPLAGAWSDRAGPRTPIVTGLGLQSVALFGLAASVEPDGSYLPLVPWLLAAGVGMSLVLAPSASAAMAGAADADAGMASGVTNAIREIGGVFGVAVLVSVFAAAGGYGSPGEFVAGVRAALPWGGGVLAVAALIGMSIPARQRVGAPEPVNEQTAPRSLAAP